MKQLDLELKLLAAYGATDDPISNKRVYNKVNPSHASLDNVEPIGAKQQPCNLFHRKVRWCQQTLKQKGLLKRLGRGEWAITKSGKTLLTKIQNESGLIAFSTEFGVAIWGDSRVLMKDYIEQPVHLCFTSPPYPLQSQRAYGSSWENEQGYIDFICAVLEPIIKKLVDGGSIALNLSNDIFNKGKPSRSLYLERLTLALHDRLGLELMDRHAWKSNKAPSPLIWSSIKRIQLNAQYEHVLWFCNNPIASLASIDRVLEPHTERHKQFIQSGGVKHYSEYGDGSHKKRRGDFSNKTKGKIPHNAYYLSNYCASTRKVNQYAKDLGIPTHGAKMPLSIAEFYIKYLTEEGHTVVDPCGGTVTTGEAAEKHKRHWIVTDLIWEYLRQGVGRFNNYWINPSFLSVR